MPDHTNEPNRKQKVKDYIENSIEYKNPKLPWNQPQKHSFPPPDARAILFMKGKDQYGNPRTKPKKEYDAFGNCTYDPDKAGEIVGILLHRAQVIDFIEKEQQARSAHLVNKLTKKKKK